MHSHIRGAWAGDVAGDTLRTLGTQGGFASTVIAVGERCRGNVGDRDCTDTATAATAAVADRRTEQSRRSIPRNIWLHGCGDCSVDAVVALRWLCLGQGTGAGVGGGVCVVFCVCMMQGLQCLAGEWCLGRDSGAGRIHICKVLRQPVRTLVVLQGGE